MAIPMKDALIVVNIAMLLFFAATVAYFAVRMDAMDARIMNIEMAR